MRISSATALLSTALLLFPLTAIAEEALPKLGPDAVPVTADHAYLQTAPAPDYWAFAPFVKPQFTSSACGVASITAALNGLRGLPPLAEDTVMGQADLLETLGDAHWTAISAEGGDGVTFAELVDYTRKSAEALGMTARVESWHPAETPPDEAARLAELRKRLAANGQAATDVLMVYFNQGVVTGDWDGPHVSLIGAYDAARDRVLILEVDQDWYIPYWTPTEVLLRAMERPAPEDQGVLEGETGGLVHVTL